MSERSERMRAGQWEPVESVTTPPGMLTGFAAYLIAHGCTITYGEGEITVSFPPGALRRELFPRALEDRYEVRLPDGSFVYEHKLRARKRKDQSMLYIPYTEH